MTQNSRKVFPTVWIFQNVIMPKIIAAQPLRGYLYSLIMHGAMGYFILSCYCRHIGGILHVIESALRRNLKARMDICVGFCETLVRLQHERWHVMSDCLYMIVCSPLGLGVKTKTFYRHFILFKDVLIM